MDDDRERSLTNMPRKHSSKLTSSATVAAILVTPPSPSSLTPPDSATPSPTPRKHRSRSVGDAYLCSSRRQFFQVYKAGDAELSVTNTIREARNEESSGDSQDTSSGIAEKDEGERMSGEGTYQTDRRVAPLTPLARTRVHGEMASPPVALSLDRDGGRRSHSPGAIVSREVDRDGAVGDGGGEDCGRADRDAKGGQSPDLTSLKTKSASSVKVVSSENTTTTPAVGDTLPRRARAASCRPAGGGGGGGGVAVDDDNIANRHGRRARRHTSHSCHPRKSMPSLSVGFEQVHLESESSLKFAESPRETRKSGGSGASTSGSNGGEIIALQLDNGSPKLSTRRKKSGDFDLPPYVSKSKNAKFHKLFKNVPMDEYPIDTYSCAFKGDILLQGVMYVSQNWICFYSKIRARGRLLEIPLEKVISITREKLALIIPNAIGIQIADQKYVFGSFISRDNTYKLLVTLWKHSQDSTDSTNTKENELSCYDDFASKAGRPGRVNGSHHEDEITHSADVSAESDTSEDKDSETQETDALLETAQSSTTSRATDGGGDSKVETQPDKPPSLFSLRCFDWGKLFVMLSKFTVKLQTIPRTNLLLAICGILVLFLMLSAAGLMYKILLLQTRLEMSHLWTPGRQHYFRDEMKSSMYILQSQTHLATINQLHDVLKANIQLLQQVHQSLRSMLVPASSGSACPPAK